MAAAATLSSPCSSQDLPFRNRLDDPFSPPPSGQSNMLQNHAPPHSISPFAGLTDLQDIEDFDREHGEYQTKLVRLQSNRTSSENIVQLQQLCDKHKPKIQPTYEPKELYPQNWTAKVIVLGEVFEATGLFPSKDQARDAAARLAIEGCKAAFANNLSAGTKRKNDERSSSSTAVDRSEDWISLLLINASQKKRFKPNLVEESTDKPPYSYFCTIMLDGGPMEPFKAGPYVSKKDAKTASAKLAVEWLRSHHPNHLTTLAKRPKQEHTQSSHTGITQAFAVADIESAVAPHSPSKRQQVHNLVAALGLRTMTIDCNRSEMPDGLPANATWAFYDVAAYFDPHDVELQPFLKGAFGRVERVHGENKAKEACCEKVLSFLEKLKQSKMGRTALN